MALKATSKKHQKQIDAGIIGRKKGHKFEETLTKEINSLKFNSIMPVKNYSHIHKGNPAFQLLQYIANDKNLEIKDAKAWWLGGLATSGQGDIYHDEDNNPITKSKSDILIRIDTNDGLQTIGVSIKTCNKKTPTNAQLFFTTARAFCLLLRENGINVTSDAEKGLSMFCGDTNFRPCDLMETSELKLRVSDSNRYYWEELPIESRKDLQKLFSLYQDDVTRLLFQKAYKNASYPPEYLLHQTVKYEDFNFCETALFSMDEIINLSKTYGLFQLNEYKIRKGTYKNDPNTHLAPRFGFVQFQRGGQKQHPTQLQFNLKAGYFKYI